MARITKKHRGNVIEACFHTSRSDPDRFGKREGYRVTPPGAGHNLSQNAVCYRSEQDAIDHLLANPDWGIRMGPPGATSGNIHHDDILVDGNLR